MNEKILVNKDSLEKMQTKLRGLKVMLEDKEMLSTIIEILDLVQNELKIKDISVEDMIKDKMNETKFSNPELNFKLYMLYRKLEQGKIDTDEALKAYELYVKM